MLTNGNDKDRFLEKTEGSTGWHLLGEQVYNILVDQVTEKIGKVKADLGEYKEAIVFNQKTLAIRQKSLSHSHSDLAVSNNNIGLIDEDTGPELGEQSSLSNRSNLQDYLRNFERIKRNCDYSMVFSVGK